MKPHYQVAAALIFENGRVFAAKRGKTKYAYTSFRYEFPGGKIEDGENGKQALERELIEELSMKVQVGNLYASNTFEYPDFIVTLWLYECDRLSNYTLNEHVAVDWILPKDLKEEEWAPADKDVIGALKRIFGE